jgi:uncharacterized protein YyaL (SSP411 family)
MNLLRLARMTGREGFERSGIRAIEAFASRINSAPNAAPLLVSALLLARAAPRQVVITGESAEELLSVYHNKFLPDFVLLRNKPGMPALDGKATAYVCEDFACRLPVTEAEKLDKLLK